MRPAVILAVTAVTAAAAPLTPLKTPDGRHIADWQPQANPKKPYIAQLYAPGAKSLPLLDDSPADHFHHHGLMFALGADGTDFWAEKGAPNIGTQQPAGYRPLPAGNGYTQTLRWLAADGTHLLDETRTVKVRATGSGADALHWLDWQSVLTPAPNRESVKLSGSH
ncbi:MAG: PmoA family protein, partial [Akkermansiaceae bacterium]|nr:PmoA family protein [Akkermansiaceae bacterium]